ncbi:MAG: formylglycine-generating enzyme family protein [Chlorobium sp.]|nr:MAG: formylglycine-generating enzyme family protein [Chlorobium sp.]
MLLLISSLVIYQCKKLSPSTEPPANPANIDSVASKLKLPDNFVLIKGGSFTMGSLEGEYGHQSDETQHTVKLGDFAMCRYEVTVGEYLRFAKETKSHYPAWLNADSISTGNKDFYKNLEEALTGERYPIVGVSWNDAQAYCEWLTKKWKNGRYRLPTEAEWEYACRGGTASPFNTGENLTTVQANYDGNFPYWNNPKGEYRRKTVMVESFKPNDYGLFNMHGNVWEWCHDWYDGKYFDECLKKGIVDNPLGPERGSHRVVRGGSWVSRARYCRSACRNYGAPNIRSDGVGFRLVFVPQVQSTAHPAKM